MQKGYKFFAFFFLLASVFITDSARGQTSSFFSYRNRLSFANHLFCQKDYIRAFDEYTALLTQTPNDTLRLWAGISLQKLKRYDEAEDYFKGLFFFSSLQDEGRCEFFKTKFLRKDYRAFFNDEEHPFETPVKYNREYLKLKYFSLFYLPEKGLPDSAKLLRLYSPDEAEQIATFYHRAKNLPYKNPTTAALLSAVIPGAGKIYTEDYSDGITAFLFTSLFYGLSAYKFSDDKTSTGILYAAIGLFFHAGSVYGSAAAANLFNERKEIEFKNALNNYAQKKNYFLPDFSPRCK